MFKALGQLLAWPLLALVWLYRYTISPFLGNNCRYDPSCSAYAIESLRKHGAFRGSWLAAKRIARCHPWGGSGYDPVPEHQVDQSLSRERTAVLNHAYGFISRGNRDGGFKHLYGHLDLDPEPDTAWQWFFEQMLGWEIQEPALLFGQQYLSRLLDDGNDVVAVKLMMRCRLINEAFKPLPEDRERALIAAEHCQNDELISILR